MSNRLQSNDYYIFINEDKNALLLLDKTSRFTFNISRSKVDDAISLLTEAKKLLEG